MDHGGAPAGLNGQHTESRPLTGLRGIAALLVMLHHFYLHLPLDQHIPMLQWLLRKGYMGVDLFFVLSGFVMCLAYAPWFDGRRPVTPRDYLRFIARRLARLWPLQAAVLLVLVAAGIGLPVAVVSPRMFMANLLMVQAWGLSMAINPPAWSISTEFMAYLLFPFLVPLCLRSRAGPLVMLAGVAALLAYCMAVAPPIDAGRRGRLDLYFNYSILPLLRCMIGFTLGMLAFRIRRWPPLRALAGTPWFGPLLLAAVFAMLLGRVNDMLTLAVLPPLVLGLFFGHGPVHRLLSMNPIHALGVLSYATYLIHYALLGVFPFGWAPLGITLPAYILVTTALAALAHHAVERPGRRLFRALAGRALATPAPNRATAGAPPLQDTRR